MHPQFRHAASLCKWPIAKRVRYGVYTGKNVVIFELRRTNPFSSLNLSDMQSNPNISPFLTKEVNTRTLSRRFINCWPMAAFFYLDYVVRKGFPRQANQRVAIGLSRNDEGSPWTWTNGKSLGYKNGDLGGHGGHADRATDCAYLSMKGVAPFVWINDYCDPHDAFKPVALCEREA